MESGVALHSVLEHAFVVPKHRQGRDTQNLPDPDRGWQGGGSWSDRKLGHQLVVVVDKKKPLFRVDVDFPVSERRVRLREALTQVLDFKRQDVRYFHGVAGFEGVEVHSRVKLTNVSLRGMKSFCDKIEKRSIFQRLQLRLLRRLGCRRSDKILRFRRNRISRKWIRHLIKQPLINDAGLAHAMRALIMHERLAEKFAHLAIDLPRAEIIIIKKDLEPRRCHFVKVR